MTELVDAALKGVIGSGPLAILAILAVWTLWKQNITERDRHSAEEKLLQDRHAEEARALQTQHASEEKALTERIFLVLSKLTTVIKGVDP